MKDNVASVTARGYLSVSVHQTLNCTGSGMIESLGVDDLSQSELLEIGEFFSYPHIMSYIQLEEISG